MKKQFCMAVALLATGLLIAADVTEAELCGLVFDVEALAADPVIHQSTSSCPADTDLSGLGFDVEALVADEVINPPPAARDIAREFNHLVADCYEVQRIDNDSDCRDAFLTRVRRLTGWVSSNKDMIKVQPTWLRVIVVRFALLGWYFLRDTASIQTLMAEAVDRYNEPNAKELVREAQALLKLSEYVTTGAHADLLHRVVRTTVPNSVITHILSGEWYRTHNQKYEVPGLSRNHQWNFYRVFVVCMQPTVPASAPVAAAGAPAPQAQKLKKAASAATLALSGQDTSGSNSSADRLTPSAAGVGDVPKEAQTATSPPRPKRRGAIAAVRRRKESDDFDWFVHEDGSPKDPDEDAVGVANFFAALSGPQYAAPEAGTKKRGRR